MLKSRYCLCGTGGTWSEQDNLSKTSARREMGLSITLPLYEWMFVSVPRTYTEHDVDDDDKKKERQRQRQNNTRNSLRLFSVLRAIITVMVVDHSTSSLKATTTKTVRREKGSTDIQIHLFNCTVNVQETLVIVWCRRRKRRRWCTWIILWTYLRSCCSLSAIIFLLTYQQWKQ